MERKRFSGVMLLFIVLAVVLITQVVGNLGRSGDVSYSDMRAYFTAEKVKSFTATDTRLVAKLQDGSSVSCTLHSFDTFYNDMNDLVVSQAEKGVITSYDYAAGNENSWLRTLLPYVLAAMAFILLMNLIARMGGMGGGFGGGSFGGGFSGGRGSFGGGHFGVDGPQVGKAEVFFCNGQHPGAAEGVVRAVGIGMAALVQHGLDDPAGSFVVQLLPDGIGGHQFGHVQHGVRVTGEHTGTAGAVHAALATLCAFAVVVAVDHRTAQLGAHLVELVAKMRHLIGAVLVAGDDLVDGVEDDGGVAFLTRPADELGGQLVHGDGSTAQVPDVNVPQVLRGQAEGSIHILEAVQAGGPVQLEVDVQHFALGTGKAAQPGRALGNGNAQLNEGEALARLAGACQKHLVSLAQHPEDERVCQRGQVLPVGGEVFGVR